MQNREITVSSALSMIKRSLESEFRSLVVVGEVVNFSPSSSGHYYFSLTDGQSSLSCAMFRMDAMRNPVLKKLKNGDKVICHGGIGVYAKRGSFQLIAKRIEVHGKGDLKEQFELLKKRLSVEGLFDMEHKKDVPSFPRRIGLISGHDSAAYFDFLNVMKRRAHKFDILFTKALVQGDASAASLRSALTRLIKYNMSSSDDKKLDVIVLTRGGGSLEDLWSFNDEGLAWDIFNCPIPVISAVGHDVDYSISDYVADIRCETPTAAAEFLCRGQYELVKELSAKRKSLELIGQNLISEREFHLQDFSPIRFQSRLLEMVNSKRKRLQRLDISHRLQELTGLFDKLMRLEDVLTKLKNYPQKIENYKLKATKLNDLLSALNPNSILGRGYSYLKVEEGNLIPSTKAFDKLEKKQRMIIHFQDGKRAVLKD